MQQDDSLCIPDLSGCYHRIRLVEIQFQDFNIFVFVNTTGGVIDDSKLRRRYYAALEQAGLKRLNFHSLRHVFGTIAVQAFPLSDVKAYMGHADIQTTMIYVHVMNKPAVAVTSPLDRLSAVGLSA